MSKGINKVILIGNLGADPVVRYTSAGAAIANTTLATSDTWKDKQSGETQENTEWHKVVFFNKLAEIVSGYLKKGSKIYVEGALRTRKWEDKNKKEIYTTEIIAKEMHMLGASAPKEDKPSWTSPKPTKRLGDTSTGLLQSSKQTDILENTPEGKDFDDDIPF